VKVKDKNKREVRRMVTDLHQDEEDLDTDPEVPKRKVKVWKTVKQ
jgi:hypothetical protein